MNKIKKYIPLIVLSLFVISCGEQKTSSNSAELSNQPRRTDKKIAPENMACYLSSCFATVARADLVDPRGDYEYENPNDFSNPSLRPQYFAPIAFLDLSAISTQATLAPNFKLGEFLQTRKGRYGLIQSHVITKMQLIRNAASRSIRVNSGYRSPGYNARTDGAAKWSRHMYGDAVDFVISGLRIKDMPQFCKNQGASFTLTYTAHVHCDWRKDNLDPAFFGPQNEPGLATLEHVIPTLLAAAESSILLQEDNNNWVLSTNVPAAEAEEGELTHEWTIEYENGEIITFTEPYIRLPKSTGIIKIKVLVGNSIELYRELK